MNQKLTAVLLAVFLLAACSREGFYEAVGKTSPGEREESSSQAENGGEEKTSFETVNGEIDEENAEIYYCVPDTQTESSAAAAAIEKESSSMALEIAGMAPDGGKVSLFDGMCDNNENWYSAEYELVLRTADGTKTKKSFGLVFSAQTGEAVPLTDVIDAGKLAARMLDDTLSEVDASSDEEKAQLRAALSDLGAKGLEDLLKDADGAWHGEAPSCSYTLESGEITVMLNGLADTTVIVRCPDAV